MHSGSLRSGTDVQARFSARCVSYWSRSYRNTVSLWTRRMTTKIWAPTKAGLTTVGSTAAVVAIGAVALANAAPFIATVVALGSAAIATGSLYAKVTGAFSEEKTPVTGAGDKNSSS